MVAPVGEQAPSLISTAWRRTSIDRPSDTNDLGLVYFPKLQTQGYLPLDSLLCYRVLNMAIDGHKGQVATYVKDWGRPDFLMPPMSAALARAWGRVGD